MNSKQTANLSSAIMDVTQHDPFSKSAYGPQSGLAPPQYAAWRASARLDGGSELFQIPEQLKPLGAQIGFNLKVC